MKKKTMKIVVEVVAEAHVPDEVLCDAVEYMLPKETRWHKTPGTDRLCGRIKWKSLRASPAQQEAQ